jgi:hypothetical protein|tara:strand:- start:3996 stop:5861 length:1866 start_codon:yes stop_codon:yes gene_type:complete
VPLQKLEFPPGIDREGTNFSNTGGWYDGDLIRFRSGVPEAMGGWEKTNPSNTFSGIARSLHPWTNLGGTNLYGMGTHLKYYIVQGWAFNDITPIRASSTINNNPFTTDAAGSAVVTVTDTAHGAVQNDYVTYSGSSGAIDGIPQAEFNAEHQITDLIDADNYRITMTTTATSGSVSGGGASVVAAYQITTGLSFGVGGSGWGAGGWGDDGYGDPSEDLTPANKLRLWSEDTFGEDLVLNVRDDAIYYWDASAGTGTRAAELSTLTNASDTPTVCRFVIMSPEDRHLLAFGCNELGSATQDPMLIRWPATESIVDWTPDADNTAGDRRLSGGSEIITGIRTKQEILVWTDTSLHSVKFLGPPFTFGSRMVADNTSIIAPNAAIAVDNTVYWMGRDNFYMYDGRVRTLPCSVRFYLFDRINRAQAELITTGINRSDNEVIWFYPSSTNTTTDSYVIYNYLENAWYYGVSLNRSVWSDTVFDDYPIAAGTDGVLYFQEKGCDDGSTNPASAITAFVESSDFELGDGYQFSFVRRILHDVTFDGSSADSPAVDMILTPRRFPGSGYKTAATSTVTRTAASPETFTEQTHIRIRGRATKFKVQSSATGVFWRLGTPRIDIRPDGRR